MKTTGTLRKRATSLRKFEWEVGLELLTTRFGRLRTGSLLGGDNVLHVRSITQYVKGNNRKSIIGTLCCYLTRTHVIKTQVMNR